MDQYEHLTDAQWDLCDRMSAISEDCFCAGWIYWTDGPQFAPMAQWLAMVDARRKLAATRRQSPVSQ